MSLFRLLTSGKLPVRSFWERSSLESMLRLLNEEGTWPVRPLKERDKTSNLVRFPNSEGSEEEAKLL